MQGILENLRHIGNISDNDLDQIMDRITQYGEKELRYYFENNHLNPESDRV